MVSYKQDSKNKIRNCIFGNAIDILTTRRDNAAVVSVDYVAKAFEYFKYSKDKLYRHCYNEYYNQELIKFWEEFHSSFVRPKEAKDLKVAYLCGPEPMNDFAELIKFGIHPQNIWAFENNNKEYDLALLDIKKSYPLLKIYNGTMQEFFEIVPKKFDIVYVDACGPLPSTDSKTLTIISSLFKFHRLSSPGVLLSNFACPDFTNDDIKDQYAFLIGNYLFSKEVIEQKNSAGSWGNFYLGEEDCYSSKDLIKNIIYPQIEFNYGSFITRILFDLPSHIIPWFRLTCATNLWKKLFNQNTCTNIQSLFPEFPDTNSLQSDDEILKHIIVNFNLLKSTEGWFSIIDSGDKLCSKFIKQLFYNQLEPKSIKDSLVSFYMLTQFYDNSGFNYKDLYTDTFIRALYNFNSHNLIQGCDVPNASMGFSLITGQYSYPMHYNLRETKRWQYKAKQTNMYTDMIVFDECRYMYEWMPTLDLFSESLVSLPKYAIILQIMMDALFKHSHKYNKEYFDYSTFIAFGEDDYFNPIDISPRIILK